MYHYQTATGVTSTTPVPVEEIHALVQRQELHENSYIYNAKAIPQWTPIVQTFLYSTLFPTAPTAPTTFAPPARANIGVVEDAARRSSFRRLSHTSTTSTTSTTSNPTSGVLLAFDFQALPNNPEHRRSSLVDTNHPHLNKAQLQSLDLNPSRKRTDHDSGRTFVKPKQVYCYLCGREFGTNSLKIHWKSCRRKYQASQPSSKQGKRIPRKPLPLPPDEESFPCPTHGRAAEHIFYHYNVEALRIFGTVTGNMDLWHTLKAQHDRNTTARDLARVARAAEEAQRRAGQEEQERKAAARLLEEAQLRVLRARRAALNDVQERRRAALALLQEWFEHLDSFSNGEESWSRTAWLSVSDAEEAACPWVEELEFARCTQEEVDAGDAAVRGFEGWVAQAARCIQEAYDARQGCVVAEEEEARRQRALLLSAQEEEEARRQRALLLSAQQEEEARRQRALLMAQEKKGRFLKRGDGRRAADQARVGIHLRQEQHANRTRLRNRQSIVQGNRDHVVLKEEGVDLHYHEWNPNAVVDTTWRKGHVGGDVVRVVGEGQ